MEDIDEIRQDLKKCTSLGEKAALNERAVYIEECLERIIKEVDPRKAITPIEGCNEDAITALKYFNDRTYEEIEKQLNKLIDDINSFDISNDSQFSVLEWATIFYYVDEKGSGKVCETQRFDLKIYDKSLQYSLPGHLLRYEIKIKRIEFFKQYSINALVLTADEVTRFKD